MQYSRQVAGKQQLPTWEQCRVKASFPQMQHSRQVAGKQQRPHLGAMQGEGCGCCLLKLLGIQGLHLLVFVIVFSPAPHKANG